MIESSGLTIIESITLSVYSRKNITATESISMPCLIPSEWRIRKLAMIQLKKEVGKRSVSNHFRILVQDRSFLIRILNPK